MQVCTFKGMDEATIELINREFVPLAHNAWGFGEVLTARGDVVTTHLRSGDTGGPNGVNNPFAPKRLQAALEKFKQLPAEKRQANIEDLPSSWKGKAPPIPPAEGIILRQYRRSIHRDADGTMHRQALYHDFFWMTKAEWHSLVPERPRVGDSWAVPDFLVSRIGNHHAHMLCSAGSLRMSATPKANLTLTVESASPELVRLRLQGSVKVTESQSNVVIRGVLDYQICGCLDYDVKKKTFSRFDMVALAETTNYQKEDGPPKGRALLAGLLFELSPGDTAWERTPPLHGGQKEYLQTGQ